MTRTATPAALFDSVEVRRALALLLPAGQVTELRALDATTADDRRPHTLTGYFDDREKLVKALGTIKSAKGVYLIPNAVDPALLARAENRIKTAGKGDSTPDSNITRRLWLLADCDCARPSGISATDEEHDAAIERTYQIRAALSAEGWPEPIVADSGNGGHALYRIDLPTDDGGLVQRCLAALQARFGDGQVHVDESVFNPARIWKLYGTLACKGDSTASRPHRMARILEAPDALRIVPRELLEALAASAPKPEATTAPRPAAANDAHLQPFDLPGFIERHKLNVGEPRPWNGGTRWVFNESPLCDHHAGEVHLIQLASGALSVKCKHASCQGKVSWAALREKYEPREQRHAGNGLAHRLDDYFDSLADASDELEPLEVDMRITAEPPTAAEPVKRRTFQVYTPAELSALDLQTNYLIDGVLARHQSALIAGVFKTLKTSVAANAAFSIATATRFLDKFACRAAAKVLFMSAEAGLRKLRSTFQRIGAARGIDFAGIGPSLLTCPAVPMIGCVPDHAALERAILDHEVEVVFVDPAYRAMAASADSAGNVFKVGALLSYIDMIAERTGTTIILVHHCAKHSAAAFEPPELRHVSMAGYAEWARQWLLLGPRATWNPDTGEHRLWLSYGGSEGHAGCWGLDVREGRHDDPGGQVWQTKLLTLDEVRTGATDAKSAAREQAKEAALESNRRKIVQALVKAKQPQTATALRALTALGATTVNVTLASLYQSGDVDRCEVPAGNNRRLTEAWKVIDDGASK